MDVVFLTHIVLYLNTSVPGTVFPPTKCIPLLVISSISRGSCITADLYSHAPTIIGNIEDSYNYHHVKNHHAKVNGLGDLSSTVRYQCELCDEVRFTTVYCPVHVLDLD